MNASAQAATVGRQVHVFSTLWEGQRPATVVAAEVVDKACIVDVALTLHGQRDVAARDLLSGPPCYGTLSGLVLRDAPGTDQAVDTEKDGASVRIAGEDESSTQAKFLACWPPVPAKKS